MIATPAAVDVPLRRDQYGKIRIGETQILLELVIHAFQRGESAEGIVDSYPTLRLADVYAVLAYYLAHRDTVDAYVQEADDVVARLQQEAESNYDADTLALRARLRARRDEKRDS